VLAGKPEGKRPVSTYRHRWEDNIKMDIREIGLESVDWINLAQDREQCRVLENTEMNLVFHKSRGISCLAEHSISFSRRSAKWR
jgi:hypothetical protein